MNITHLDTIAVINRFPDRKEAIKKLFQKSEYFQNMCEDYGKCRQATEYWNQPDMKNSAIRSEEYALLLKDLESEIIEYLNENT